MAGKLIEIKITKATLFLTQSELVNSLSPELFKLAVKRGKAIKRKRQAGARIRYPQQEEKIY